MIGFYGGSFNPIHKGHIEVANYLLQSSFIEKVCFTPVLNHPFGKELVSYKDRVKMIELAIRGFDGLCVSLAEKEVGSNRSYTFYLLNYLKEIYGDNFFFIGGLDTLNDIDKWFRWKEIVSNFNIVFTTRADYKIDREKAKKIEEKSGRKINFVRDVASLNPVGLNLVEVPFIPVSSTKIRENLKRNQDLSGILHNDVILYIYQKKLY